ncbi:MAG: septation ring formation regulator EzrA [Oscillospiraceae bacterium]|nr:septation ring formation regulator EzrA [Oscillospiraceae bacterium]
MKSNKIIAMFCVLALPAAFSGCGNKINDSGDIENDISDIVETMNNETSAASTEISVHEVGKSNTTEKQIEVGAGGIEELNLIVEQDIADTIDALSSDYEQLTKEIDTYEKYLNNIDAIELFYSKAETVNEELCIKMYEYSLSYAELIVNSDRSFDDKYNDFEQMYDAVYEDGGDDIYDGIYDGILDDMYDDFYDGIVKDGARDQFNGSDRYNVRSDEYQRWSDTRSEVYSFWSDFRSDVYGFWSDMRSEMWSEDTERAEKKIEKFKKKIEKLKNRQSETAQETTISENADVNIDSTLQNDGFDESNTIKKKDGSVSSTVVSEGIRPEIKEALDEYESFFDDYCEFMTKYQENTDDLDILSDYIDIMYKYDEIMEKLEELKNTELTDEEEKYYLEVQSRITSKLLSIS